MRTLRGSTPREKILKNPCADSAATIAPRKKKPGRQGRACLDGLSARSGAGTGPSHTRPGVVGRLASVIPSLAAPSLDFVPAAAEVSFDLAPLAIPILGLGRALPSVSVGGLVFGVLPSRSVVRPLG